MFTIRNLSDMHTASHSQTLPHTLLSILPFTFFFPVGIMYVAVLLFLFAWLWSGEFASRWRTVRSSSVFAPIVLLIGVVYADAIFLSADNTHRWSGLVHYQIFLFLLLFISIGGGAWQQQAKKFFYAGALYGASVFYLAHVGIVPDWIIFKNYTNYEGNKSISLGIFLAISAACLLNEAIEQSDPRKKSGLIFCYAYIAIAVLFFAITRTGILLLFFLSGIVVVCQLAFNRRGQGVAFVAAILICTAWQFSSGAHERMKVTFQALSAYTQGEVGTGQGNRLQFVKFTGQMILEKPLLGHGVGSWLQQYPQRAQGLETAAMTTPHNDYLLYAAELGIAGLIALLGVLANFILIARRIGGQRGTLVLLITSALIVGSLFNAILRDWKFGMPMMILLAMAIAGAKKTEPKAVPGLVLVPD